MALFTWYNKYSVNDEALDEHHKKLFDLLNKLYENCMGNVTINSLDPIMKELVSYSNYHFSAEEEHMRVTGYKDIDKHILEHRSFTQRTLQLQQDINKDDFAGSKELIVFLGNWLLHHVIEEDKKYTL